MSKYFVSNVKLGLFVMVGLVFLIGTLYFIGNNQNLFDSTIKVHATFYNVNGLMAGNNVRFSGIDVGTVKEVEIISDTAVNVTMVIKQDVIKFIKKNSVAAVGTDGLMGNKLVNITTSDVPSEPIEDGDVLVTFKPIDTDEMLRTLSATNNNLAIITSDLTRITQKVNNSRTLWSLLTDSTVADNMKQSITNIRVTSSNTAELTRNLNGLVRDVREGKGMAGLLIHDTVSPVKLKNSLINIHNASEAAVKATQDIQTFTEHLKQNGNAASVLVNDTTFANDLKKTMRNLRTGTEGLNQNMEAMKHNFLFRGYYKKQDKQKKKDSQAAPAGQNP